MLSTKGPYVHVDHVTDFSETSTGMYPSQPVRSATGSYWPDDTNTATSAQGQTALEIPVEYRTYGSRKPRRVVVRGKILRDQNQG
jgi:hypothetical protein